MLQNQNKNNATQIIYPPIGSLIHIDQTTELIGFCQNSGTISVVADEDTFGIILSHDSLEQGASVEVIVGTESWNILYRYTMQDREFMFWPFVVIPNESN